MNQRDFQGLYQSNGSIAKYSCYHFNPKLIILSEFQKMSIPLFYIHFIDDTARNENLKTSYILLLS